MAPERVVSVRLSAQIADYKRSMLEAAQSTRAVGAETEKLAQTKQAFEAVGRGAQVMGGLLAAGVTIAVAKAAEFDAAMSNVQAATGETAANMDLLREAAIDAGASTVYSATEAANAIEELSKAGVSAADILSGALAGSLDLAAAGQLGVARAAEITSTALNQYGLAGTDASHVADVLAAGAGKAMGSVEDLANGLKFVGPVAAAMGVSLEDTAGTLALFAQQGIIGEQAGTSLRGVLSSLTAPSAQARTEIERLGLQLYDSQGNFLGLENAAGQLANAYTNMDGASRDASLGIVFGRETITAATALYKAGADGVDEWSNAVDDSGYAAEQARMRLDNLKGDLEALQGALDSALIQSGGAANDSLRALAQSLTGLVDMFNDLPEPVQQATLVIGGATAAVLLAGGTALNVVPKFFGMQSAVRGAGLSMSGMSLAAGGAGLAVAGLFAVVGELARAQAEAKASAEAYATTLADGTNKVTAATEELVVQNLAASKQVLWWQQDSAFENARTLGVSLDVVKDATLGNVDALKEFNRLTDLSNKSSYERAEMADRLGISMTDLDVATGQLRDSVRGESQSIEDAISVSEQKDEANKKTAGSTAAAGKAAQTAAGEYLSEADAVSSTRSELERLIGAINDANGVSQDAISANIDYQNALAKADETIAKVREGAEGYSGSIDRSTQAGRDNVDMFIQLAQQAQGAADAQFALDGNTDAYRQNLENSRQALVDRITDLTGNADAAGTLADEIYRIPTEREFTAIAKTQEAMDRTAAFKALWEGISSRTLFLTAVPQIGGAPVEQAGPLASGYVFGQAAGGPVIGPGTGTSDSILRRLSNNEHVVTAREVEAAGGHAKVAEIRQAMLSGKYSATDPASSFAPDSDRWSRGFVATPSERTVTQKTVIEHKHYNTFTAPPGISAEELLRTAERRQNMQMRGA